MVQFEENAAVGRNQLMPITLLIFVAAIIYGK
jgi:hypothetical protein